MKNKKFGFGLLLLTFLLATSSVTFAFKFEDVLKKANDFYKNEQYKKAIETYNTIIEQGYESVGLYYNIGNCYYKLGKLGYAILYYEKALKLNPDDEDVNYNLKIAKAHTVDKIKEVPQIFLVKWWEALLAAFTLQGWAVVSSVFFLFFIVALGFYYLTKNISVKRFSFLSGSVLLPLFLLSLFLLIFKYNREVNTKFGVVIENVVNVKQSPDEKSTDAFIVHEGLKFKIEDSLDGWVKVKLPDGKVGWMKKEFFGEI